MGDTQDVGITDLYLAAHLQSNGHDVLGVELALGSLSRNGDTKIAFKFKQTPDLKKDLLNFPSTETYKYINVVYALKRMLKTMDSK